MIPIRHTRHIAVTLLAVALTQPTAASIHPTQTANGTIRATPDPLPPDQIAARNAAPDAATTVTAMPSLPSNAPEYTSDKLFQSAILNSTNFFRREHNATAATWNATIAQFAASYLDGDSDCTFAHSGGPYGENIAVGFQTVHGAIDAFGLERRLYDFNHPSFSEATGHFTQLVWKASTTVGCARKLCGGAAAGMKNTGWFLVCEYWPRGNVIGQFAQEVDRQTSGPGADDSDGNGDGEPSVAAGKPSMGGVAAAVVVFVMLTAAFANDVRLTVADA
ncbi:extracellular scp domain containing protein [Sporothrix brasiliensis 5110]|uniref:Extracellular scp domain containing protein n=1 Tax=Sporothrix brasiliensis 5110 TaxID=1398154 RepID=A0A0C2J1W2_9PEZI|nr:extracellular scp domain containing protein [Sporothrix brasiliensis 5110]KIH95306.1 extracellular scp domain containing protein [Sporothrix brasiliensis 5110]